MIECSSLFLVLFVSKFAWFLHYVIIYFFASQFVFGCLFFSSLFLFTVAYCNHSFIRSFVRSFIHSFSLSLLVCLLPCCFSLFGWLVFFSLHHHTVRSPSTIPIYNNHLSTATRIFQRTNQPALVILYEPCLQWPQLFNSQFILLQGAYCGQGVWLNCCV